MAGGEARALTEVARGAGAAVWSPSGRRIAFLSTTMEGERTKAEEKSDVRVINRAAYRSNGRGYTDFEAVEHIWTIQVPTVLAEAVKAAQLTKGKFADSQPAWSNDESRLYFTSDHTAEPYYEPPQTDLYAVEMKSGVTQKLSHLDGAVRELSLSPDGTQAAFVSSLRGNPVRSYSQPDLFVIELTAGAKAKNLTTDYDYDIGGSIGGDQAPPRGSSPSIPYWSSDGRSIFVTCGEKGRSNLKRVDAGSGKVEAVTKGDQDVYSYHATPDGGTVAMLISNTTNIGDVFVMAVNAPLKRSTRVNDRLFTMLDLPAPEEIMYKSFDGKMIQGFVQKPPNFDASRKYPLILNIHGGPHSAYGFTFFHEMQWMAAKGYVVLYPNPRGSTTFGQEFGNIIQYKYPGDDYKDLMAGVDALIAKGYVDANRLGVTGGSGGGILTNWTITQTTRFKAAVAQRSIADWSAFWYTADFTLFTPTWFRDAPWRDAADFKARSPITFVEKIQTPLMLVEGEIDLRCPPGAGGEEMFRALKFLKKPTVMIQFPGESHELSRSGKPVHRVERLQHIVGWFDKYLMGMPMPMYDVTGDE
jgi:dipeptidyl aminopeptidase/acylaminoacyl peptidase